MPRALQQISILYLSWDIRGSLLGGYQEGMYPVWMGRTCLPGLLLIIEIFCPHLKEREEKKEAMCSSASEKWYYFFFFFFYKKAPTRKGSCQSMQVRIWSELICDVRKQVIIGIGCLSCFFQTASFFSFSTSQVTAIGHIHKLLKNTLYWSSPWDPAQG